MYSFSFSLLSDMIFDPIGCIRAIFQDKLDSQFDTHYTHLTKLVKGVKKAYDRRSTEVEPTKDMGGALSHVTKAAVQGVGLV